MAGVRILLIDDHSLFADALRGVLDRLGPKTEVQSATSAEHALSELERGARFDLILLDLGLPGVKGRAAFDAVRARASDTPIVLVTGSDPSAEAAAMLKAGARGYVHKRTPSAELLSALQLVLEGGSYAPALASIPAPEEVLLSPRQREVLRLLAKGASNQEIADALKISPATVRVHVSSVMKALQVENRTQAATTALARRLAESS
jgi:DNA-binding NarL/FixJ family response regulator